MANKYLPGSIGINPRADRIIQDLFDRVNYLTEKIESVEDVAKDVTGLAVKESPKAGIVTIPSINGDGFIRVSKDGVIQSYTNPITTPMVPTIALYTNTADIGISNTAVPTSAMDAFTASPGSSRTIIDTVGSIYRVTSVGNIGSTVATNLDIAITIGGVIIANTANPVMTNVPVGRYFMDVEFIVNAGGSAGQVVGFMFFQYGNVPGGITALVTHTNGVLIPVNFNNPELDMIVTWSVASPAHFLQPFTLTVEKIR